MYVYDDHPVQPKWQFYALTEHGELIAFAANAPVALQDIQVMDNCTTGKGHPARSSLVSLCDAHTPRAVYLMFLELPLTEQRLNDMAQDNAWRDKHMQVLSIAAPSHSAHYFPRSQIAQHVPEYDDTGF